MNEYTVHYEVLDNDGDQVYAGYSFVSATDRLDARQKIKDLVTLDRGESLHIWDVREE